MSDILFGLNEIQKEAVQYTEGPLLILAGAGSGKTRVLTHRIGYILEKGLCEPWQILAITFTNKAAGEMRERVDNLLPGVGQDVFVSTFHSMCVRMLRRDIDRLGYDRDFSIYDTDDQRTLMRQILKDLKLDPKQFKERGVLSAISAAKNAMTDAGTYEEIASDFYERTISRAYTEYERRLKKNNALDFDDLLLKTVELFKENPEVLASWQQRFVYIMVDEYQDTNTVQFEIVRLLSAKYKNLCVVGDDDQSIYKFRGADIRNILDFEKSFPGSKTIKLEQNYRSTKTILNAANCVIKNNKGRKDKTLWTDNEEGIRPQFKEYDTAGEEADRVISAAEKSEFPLREQAVLYRTNAQSRLFEERCIAKNLPYIIVGGVNFYQRKEIKDILSYLRIIANGVDDLAALRIVNVPKRGIGDTTIEKCRSFAAANGQSLYDAFCSAAMIPDLNRGTVNKLDCFTDEIEGYKRIAREGNIKALIEAVRDESGYAEELKKEGAIEAETRLQNIEEFISKAVGFEEEDVDFENDHDGLARLARFVENVSLVADIDRTNDSDDVLTMMTLHAAKGLEFNKIYLCGMEEGLFPSYASINSDAPDEEIEEERRLCYVGMTRAKKELCMSSARERMVNGETRAAFPSRFVDELPVSGVEIQRKPKRTSSWSDSDYRDNFDDYGDDRGSRRDYGNSRRYEGFGSGGYGGYGGGYSGGYSGGYGYGGGGSSKGYGSLDTRSKSEIKAAGALSGLTKGNTIEKVKPGYDVGDRVSHIKFGEGTVTKLEDQPKDYEVTVEFDLFGVKVMKAGFAKLTKL